MKRKRLVSLLLVLMMAFSLAAPAAIAEEVVPPEILEEFLNAYAHYIQSQYVGDVTMEELYKKALTALIGSNEELLKVAMGGMLDALDEYAYFLTGEEYHDFTDQITGAQGVIGITMQKDSDEIIVMSVLDDMPAQAAGVLPGDVITSVNGVSTEGKSTNDVAQMMAGDVGASITITISRNGTPYTFTMTRALQKVNPVVYGFQDDVAYIAIETFNAYTDEYLSEALKEADDRGITKIILDLRYNGGGQLSQAVAVASHFVDKKKPVVTIKYKNEQFNETYNSTAETTKYQVAVLVNEYSASASEIVTAAIQDNECGYVIGTRTYGKGTVQSFMPIPAVDGGVGITIAHYYTPNDVCIDKKGIQPDLTVYNKSEPLPLDTYQPLDYMDKPTVGTVNDNVLAIEQRLSAMGYNVGTVDREFTQETADAVTLFQANNNLFPYGVADLTTQIAIHNRSIQYKQVLDVQLDTAFEYMKSLK